MTWRKRARRSLPLTFVALAFATSSRATTEEQFRLRTGADLVALCSTRADDPLYGAAIHMCHGFGAGTYQTIQAMTRHEKLEPLFCPPDPPVLRNEAVQMFVEWAKQNPQHMGEPPVEVVGRFLIQKFPCAPEVKREEAK